MNFDKQMRIRAQWPQSTAMPYFQSGGEVVTRLSSPAPVLTAVADDELMLNVLRC